MSAGATVARLSFKSPRTSRVRTDFDGLLDRMRKRLFPETMQTLAFYWLKTICSSGYRRAEWKALDRFLEQALRRAQTNTGWHDTLASLQASTRDEGLLAGEASPPPKSDSVQATRPMPSPEMLAPYFVRLLNEWAPKELARILLDAPEENTPDGPENRALAFGRALERVLLREHLPPRSLKAVFQPNLFSPQFVCPAECEILRDVILFLLGRTEAPAVPALPAALLGAAPGFRSDYAQAVRDALLVNREEREELHVLISPAQAMQILQADQFRITSLVVTMDGRWWQADKLLGGEQNVIVHRPVGRLRVDYSSDHARLRVPWTETRLRWSGDVSFPVTVDLFGRRWHVAEWEQAAEHTWLNLACAGPLPVDAMGLSEETDLKRCRPAWVDMGWTALETALAASLTQKNAEPIEKLRHDELIPLGRALHALTESVMNRRLRTPEAIEARLTAVSFHAAGLRASYGLVPWRIVPEPAREILLGRHLYPVVSDRLRQVFGRLPETFPEPGFLTRLWNRRAHSPAHNSPRRAA